VDSKSQDIVRRYVAGELDLESAAQGIHESGEWSLFYSPSDTSPADLERIQALFGRVLWLSMRESDPDSVPDHPFGAEEFRAFAAFRDASDEIQDPGPTGAP
jgi:hypothetical protein